MSRRECCEKWKKEPATLYCDGYVVEPKFCPECASPLKEPEDEYTGGIYKKGIDPEVTCWHCKKTFLCDCMDATCRLCGAPYKKSRCEEFKFKPKEPSFCSCEDPKIMQSWTDELQRKFCMKCKGWIKQEFCSCEKPSSITSGTEISGYWCGDCNKEIKNVSVYRDKSIKAHKIEEIPTVTAPLQVAISMHGHKINEIIRVINGGD